MAYAYRHTETYQGKRIDIKANTQAELLDKLNKKRKAIDRNTLSINSNIRLKPFCDQYIKTYKEPRVSEAWAYDLQLISDKHIVGTLGNRPVNTIKLIEVQNMLNLCDFSHEYLGKIFNLTCQIFHSAYKNGLTPYDYSLDLERPNGRKAKNGKRLTQEEQEAMLHVLPGHRAEMLCKVMYYCGLRTIEARNLLWGDIDLDNRTIHIRGTKTQNADRIVPIPAEFLPDLIAHRDDVTKHVCIADKQQALKAWRNVKRLMNIEMGCQTYRNKLIPPYPVREDLRLYDLRHTYCTNLELKGVPISIASRLMGHSNISITAKVYTHASDEAVEIARKLIDCGN